MLVSWSWKRVSSQTEKGKIKVVTKPSESWKWAVFMVDVYLNSVQRIYVGCIPYLILNNNHFSLGSYTLCCNWIFLIFIIKSTFILFYLLFVFVSVAYSLWGGAEWDELSKFLPQNNSDYNMCSVLITCQAFIKVLQIFT